MNELQRIEFNILKECIKIIEKYDLKYFLVCGSALGAAKYQGFIPWDDDIDMALPRGDYNKFVEYAKEELPEHLFLQNYTTEKYFPLFGSKVRNKNTTYVERPHKKIPMNQGVFIDVFPLDGCPDDGNDIKQFEKTRKKLQRRTVVYVDYPRFSWSNIKGIRTNIVWILNRTFRLYDDTSKYVRELNELFMRYPCDKGQYWRNYGNSTSVSDISPKWHFGEGAWAMFEGLKVRIPENYDAYLTQKYGDWRADLPEEQKAGHHYYEIMDLERPYTHYIEKLSNGKIKLKS